MHLILSLLLKASLVALCCPQNHACRSLAYVALGGLPWPSICLLCSFSSCLPRTSISELLSAPQTCRCVLFPPRLCLCTAIHLGCPHPSTRYAHLHSPSLVGVLLLPPHQIRRTSPPKGGSYRFSASVLSTNSSHFIVIACSV